MQIRMLLRAVLDTLRGREYCDGCGPAAPGTAHVGDLWWCHVLDADGDVVARRYCEPCRLAAADDIVGWDADGAA